MHIKTTSLLAGFFFLSTIGKSLQIPHGAYKTSTEPALVARANFTAPVAAHEIITPQGAPVSLICIGETSSNDSDARAAQEFVLYASRLLGFNGNYHYLLTVTSTDPISFNCILL